MVYVFARGFSQRGTLAVVCVGVGMLMLDIAVVNTALPSVARDLGAGLSGLQWVVDAYTLPLATLVLTAGVLADRLGRRRVFVAGLALFTAASLACALAPGIVLLDCARAVQGAGGALMFATALALLADAFREPRERAGALAAYGAAVGASFAIAPLLGGALTSWLGWRTIFLLNVPIGIAAVAATLRWARESRDPEPRRVDWRGQVTLTSGLFLLVLGLMRGNSDGWTSPVIVAELAAGVMGLASFVAVEQRASAPMLPLGLFRHRAFAGAQLAAFAISASFFALFFYSTLYLQEVLGLSAVKAGLAYLPGAVAMFVVSAAGARLAARVSAGTLVVAGLVCASAGMAALLVVGTDSSWALFLPGSVMALIGTGLFNPAVSALLLGAVSPRQTGLASGSGIAFRQAGLAIGIAAFGAFVPAGAAVGHGSPDAYVTGLHHAFAVGAAVAALGAVGVAVLIGVGAVRRPAARVVHVQPVAELS